MRDEQGQSHKVRLRLASDTPIRRHVKVRSDANPYDPAGETYFEKREANHMLETFQGQRTLRFLWRERHGLCPVCNTKITRLTGWRLHHRLSCLEGGPANATDQPEFTRQTVGRAVKKQLGLYLKPTVDALDFFVVDHIEMPSPN